MLWRIMNLHICNKLTMQDGARQWQQQLFTDPCSLVLCSLNEHQMFFSLNQTGRLASLGQKKKNLIITWYNWERRKCFEFWWFGLRGLMSEIIFRQVVQITFLSVSELQSFFFFLHLHDPRFVKNKNKNIVKKSVETSFSQLLFFH